MSIELDSGQYLRLVEMRGGCSCHNRPPCGACSDAPTADELEELGIDEERTDDPKYAYHHHNSRDGRSVTFTNRDDGPPYWKVEALFDGDPK